MKYNTKQQASVYTGCLARIAILILVALFIFLNSCKKQMDDYSWMNTDRRPMVIIISERYTNPPAVKNNIWVPYKIVQDTLDRNIGAAAYAGMKPDTLRSTCSIDKVDSLFKIEIRKYIIK